MGNKIVPDIEELRKRRDEAAEEARRAIADMVAAIRDKSKANFEVAALRASKAAEKHRRLNIELNKRTDK